MKPNSKTRPAPLHAAQTERVLHVEARGAAFESMTIKLDSEYETEIFVNSNGGITVRQLGYDGSESIVFSSRERALQFIRSFREVLKVADFKPEESE